MLGPFPGPGSLGVVSRFGGVGLTVVRVAQPVNQDGCVGRVNAARPILSLAPCPGRHSPRLLGQPVLARNAVGLGRFHYRAAWKSAWCKPFRSLGVREWCRAVVVGNGGEPGRETRGGLGRTTVRPGARGLTGAVLSGMAWVLQGHYTSPGGGTQTKEACYSAARQWHQIRLATFPCRPCRGSGCMAGASWEMSRPRCFQPGASPRSSRSREVPWSAARQRCPRCAETRRPNCRVMTGG